FIFIYNYNIKVKGIKKNPGKFSIFIHTTHSALQKKPLISATMFVVTTPCEDTAGEYVQIVYTDFIKQTHGSF
ncbi:Tm-1-like ATP-binding domain-containing protein, partial [Isachenkonia alkalipeptolytica]|uniref:Tm-1-like ATP-binding domain-containing protein n=1 Tax=Isachenkonia alkalipeptolytica TaxID=2565777 RepID=UPI001F15744F